MQLSKLNDILLTILVCILAGWLVFAILFHKPIVYWFNTRDDWLWFGTWTLAVLGSFSTAIGFYTLLNLKGSDMSKSTATKIVIFQILTGMLYGILATLAWMNFAKTPLTWNEVLYHALYVCAGVASGGVILASVGWLKR